MADLKSVHLITLAAFPYTSAESIHLAMFSKAMAQLCNFTLVTPAKIWRPITFLKNVESRYGVPNRCFKQKKYLQTSIKGKRFLKLALRGAKRESAIVYARQAVVVKEALAMQLSTIWEIHSLPCLSDLQFIAAKLNGPDFKMIVVISQALKNDSVSFSGLSEPISRKIIVLPDAADESRFSVRQLNTDNPKLGYVGSAFKGKGIEIVVPLAKILSEFSFEVYGVGAGDESLDAFRPLPPNINWHGKISYADVPKALISFDIALLPNQPNIFITDGTDIGKYTSPMKLFEYMAAGRAIVASDLPIIREILNETNAVLVPHNDVYQWGERIRQLAGNHELLRQLAEQGNTDFVRYYTYLGRVNSILKSI